MKQAIAIFAICSISCAVGTGVSWQAPALAKAKSASKNESKADKSTSKQAKEHEQSSSESTGHDATGSAGTAGGGGSGTSYEDTSSHDSSTASYGGDSNQAGSGEDGSQPGSGRQPLQGKVEDTGVAPVRSGGVDMAVPIPVPVVPTGVEQEPTLDNPDVGMDQKRLTGSTRKDALHGTASDTGSQQQPLEPKMSPEEPTRLQGSASIDEAGDPDISDRELQIEWDRWRNRFMRAVQLGAQENMNNPEPEEYVAPRFDPQTGMAIPRYPMGTSAWFSCMITNDRRVSGVKIVKSSGYASYDAAIRRAVREMDGRELLTFPRGSRRKHVFQEAAITTATSNEFKYHKFNDVERYTVPDDR